VAVTLIGFAMVMGLRMLNATQNNAAWSETKLKQERIKVALVAFLRTNGRLPCPDSALPPTGAEPAACLANAGRGVLPWQALGLSVGDAQDGWSNFFTYQVANRTPATSSNWTIKSGPTAFTITELATPLTTFTLQERPAPTAALNTPITPNPVVMIISHGKNGSGARTLRGTAVIPLPVGTDELTNATTGSTSFVMRTPTDVTGGNGAFDDVVAFMTPKDLLQPLIDDKTLKGTGAYYFEQAIQQLAVASCTPPTVAVAQPLLTAIYPSVGNGVITYSCAAGSFCQTATPVHSGPPITPGAQALYQLSLFGAPAQTITYAQLQSAYPAISARCP